MRCGRLLVFCGSCVVGVVDGPLAGCVARTGLGIRIRFTIQSADSADFKDRRVEGLSEVYADDQNSSARAAMLADQSVARGCRLATIWDRDKNQSPILALVLSSGARSSIRQRIRSSASQLARNLPHINPAKFQSPPRHRSECLRRSANISHGI